MPNETVERPGSSSLLPTIIRLIDSSVKEDAGLDNLITILSLLCLISVFTRQQNNIPASSPVNSAKEKESPVNKLIESLMKGGESSSDAGGSGGIGIGPETLMSLLPLLNSPQVKSKINPSAISNVLGMLNNFGNSSSEKTSSPKEKKESSKESNKENIKEDISESKKEKEETVKGPLSRNAGINIPEPPPSSEEDSDPENYSGDYDSKNQGRYLNWKTNF